MDDNITGDISDFAAMRAELLTDGYEQRAPDGIAARNDRDILNDLDCAGCGATFVYWPFTRRDPRSYRAFGVCQHCNTAFEV